MNNARNKSDLLCHTYIESKKGGKCDKLFLRQPQKTPNSALRSLDKMLIYLVKTPLLSRSQALISGFSEVALRNVVFLHLIFHYIIGGCIAPQYCAQSVINRARFTRRSPRWYASSTLSSNL